MRIALYISRILVIALATGAGFGQTLSTPPVADRGTPRIADSVEARELLDRIAELESQGRYVQAYREYDRLLTDLADQIVQLPDGTYTGVSPEVQRRLEGWPADAKQICRDLQESSATASLQQLETSADPATIMIEAQRWWLTKSAGNTALKCATQLIQTGNTETAGWILRKLTVTHPDLAESLRTIPALAVKPSHPRASPTTTQPDAESPAPKTILWTLNAEKPSRTRSTTLHFAGSLSRPTIAGESIFIQDASRLFCLRLFSGQVEWATGLNKGTPTTLPPFHPTTDSQRVFAILPHPAPATTTTQPTHAEYALMGIDMDGSANFWQCPARALTRIVGDGSAFFQSNPLWYEQGLYAVVAGRLGAIEDMYLARINPQTGQVVWRKHLTSRTITSSDTTGPRRELSGKNGRILVREPGTVEAFVAALTGDIERISVLGIPATTRPARSDQEYIVETNGVSVRCIGRQINVTIQSPDAAAFLEQRVRDNPRDCTHRLDLARWILQQQEQAERAAAAMKDALACIESASTQPAPRQGSSPVRRKWSARRQLFELALAYADTPAISDDLQSVAAAAADSPSDEARWRLRFADIRQQEGQYATAIDLLQQILEDDVLPEQQIAAETIATLIKSQGRSVYEAVESKAARLLADAQSANNAAQLEAITRKYPNSRSSIKARLQLSHSARQANRPRQAIRWLIHGLPCADDDDRARITAQLAECCFELGDVNQGLARLARGANEFGDTPIEFADDKTTFNDACNTWRTFAATIIRPLPKWSEPIAPGFSKTFEQPFTLLECPDADDGPVVRRFGLAMVHAGDFILAIDASSGTIRWRTPWNDKQTPVWLADDDDVLVLTTPTHILALDRTTGHERWQWEQSSQILHVMDRALIDPEYLNVITSQAVSDTRMVTACRAGRVRAIRLSDGHELWDRQISGAHIGMIAVGVSEIACIRVAAGQLEAIVLDATDGHELARTSLEHAGQLTPPLFAADGTLLVADARQVIGYEPQTLKVRWRWQAPENAAVADVRVRAGNVYAYGVGFVAALTPDGLLRWKTTLPDSPPRPIRSIRAANGQVYVVGHDFIAALDAGSGRLRRQVVLKESETIEAWTLTPQCVAAVLSRPAAGRPLGPRTVEAMFIPRSAGENDPALAETRILLSESVEMHKTVLCDKALVVQAGEKLIAWRGPAAAAPSQPSR